MFDDDRGIHRVRRVFSLLTLEFPVRAIQPHLRSSTGICGIDTLRIETRNVARPFAMK
jgi:hypothetical protein